MADFRGTRRPAAGWLLLWVLVLAGCGNAPRSLAVSGPTMGTSYSVKLADVPRGLDEAALRRAVEVVLASVNRQMSTYDPQSEISRFNHGGGGQWMAVSPEFAEVARAAIHLHRRTAGAFDVTVGPLVTLWGFGPGGGAVDRIPSAAEIAAARASLGMERLAARAEPPALRKAAAGIVLDLNAIAPGFAADAVAGAVERLGAKRYLVDIGGELRLRGQNERQEPWAIAIEQPAPGRRSVQRVIRITDAAVSTSGNYRNFFELDGRRFSHEIDPRSGWPVAHATVSVTVIASSAMEADALSTALMVLGETEGLALAEREGLPALFILRDGDGFRELASTAFAPYLID